MNPTEQFLQGIDSLRENELPEAVLARVKQSLLDYLAVTFAGARFQEEKLKRYFAFAQPEPGAYLAVGTGRKLALKEAVFLNGLNGHALDYDDGTNSGIIHLGSPIFSLLLPLGQRYDISLEKLLRCAVIGYEASYTMAVSLQPGHKALGYHATGTCGVLGATLAACRMLGFTPLEQADAFSAASVSATGMLKVLDDGSELKPYNVAKTALLALTSLQLAKAGFRGHPDPLGGTRGYLKMMTGREEIELQPVLLNGTYAVQKTYTKSYASCRYTHPSVEAAISLKNRYGLNPEDVEEIRIKTYSLAVSGHDHTEIPSPYSAKMSIPYSVAAALSCGRAGLQEFDTAHVRDPKLLALTKKIKVTAEEEFSRAFPAVQTALLELKTTGGRLLSARVDYPKGEPENPFGEEEFRQRYSQLMDYAFVPREHSDQVYEAVREGEGSVNRLLEIF